MAIACLPGNLSGQYAEVRARGIDSKQVDTETRMWSSSTAA